MARIFLNELKSAERQIPLPEAGKWKTDSAFLQKFGHDIHIKGQLGDRVVNSVPSVFARPIQFYQALSSATHPMHEAVVSQWRGLLAIFALQKAMKIAVRAVPFELRDKTEKTDLDRRFVEILRSQLPHPAEEWKAWYLIYCNDQLVGATSPWTIVYTPTEYRIASGVRWIDANGVLADPLAKLYDDSEGATNDELRVLLAWLDLVLVAHPWAMPRHHEDKMQVISRELRLWREELAKVVKPYEGEKRLDVVVTQSNLPYSTFLSTLPVKPIDETVTSDLLLADDDACETIVVSRTALRGTRFQKQRVFGGVRVEDLDLSLRALPGPSGDAGWKTAAGIVIDRPYVVAEEYFLSDRLMAIPLSNAARDGGSSEYALPLRPAFFKHFGAGRLEQQIVSVEPSPDGVTVRLRLPLKNGKSLQVERVYRQTDIEQIPEGHHIPALAIWPDFYDGEWGDYEALFVDAGEKSPKLRFLPIYDHGVTGLPVALTEEQGDIAIWQSKEPVVGFGIEVADAMGAVMSAGAVVRKSVAPLKSTNVSWEVGVDFGTSNTQLKKRVGGDESPLTLHGRALLLTRATRLSEDRLAELHHRGEVVPPFPTLLQNESVLVVADGVTSRETVGLLPLNVNYVRLAASSDAFVRDVKWSADEGAQKRYLHKLVRLAAVEARAAGASRLSLRWSYPLSLPSKIRATMESFWASVGEGRTRTGFIVDGTISVSESDAVSRYVAAHDLLPIHADSLSIGLDVGGGSTDVAYWAGQTLIDRISLNVAANDVIRVAASFSEINRDIIRLTAGSAQASGSLFDAGFATRPEIMWNVLLALNKKGTPHAHPFLIAMNETTSEYWRKTRTAAFLALGGVFFYAGVHAGLHVSASTGNIDIYIGGGGSSMLSWLAPVGRLGEILTTHFAHGLQVSRPEAKPEIQMRGPVLGSSTRAQLKDEVASGLVEQKTLTAAMREGFDARVTVVGEQHWVDATGAEVPWHAPVSAEMLANFRPPANHNSSFIAYYLNRVAKPAGDRLDLESVGLNALQLSQNWAIHDIRKQTQDYALQPIFAYELKSLVRKYGESAAGLRP